MCLELSQLQIVDWFAMKEYNQDKRPFLHLYVEMSPQSLVSQAVTREILREHLSVYFKYVDQDYKDLKRILGVDPLEITILKCGTFLPMSSGGESICARSILLYMM